MCEIVSHMDKNNGNPDLVCEICARRTNVNATYTEDFT